VKKDGVRIFGRLAIEGLDQLKQEYGFAGGGLKITYKKITRDHFIISGLNKKGDIVYRKTVKKKITYQGQPGTEVFQTLMITYTGADRTKYENYCRYISGSLQ